MYLCINALSTEFLPYRLPLSHQQDCMIHYTVPRQAGVSANLVHACLLLQARSQRRNLKTPYNASRHTPMWSPCDIIPNSICASCWRRYKGIVNGSTLQARQCTLPIPHRSQVQYIIYCVLNNTTPYMILCSFIYRIHHYGGYHRVVLQ